MYRQAYKYNDVIRDLSLCTIDKSRCFRKQFRCITGIWLFRHLAIPRTELRRLKVHRNFKNTRCATSVIADHFDLSPLVMSTGARLPYLTIKTKAARVESVKALLFYGHTLEESFVGQVEVEDDNVAVVKYPLGPDVSASVLSPPYWAMAIGDQYVGEDMLDHGIADGSLQKLHWHFMHHKTCRTMSETKNWFGYLEFVLQPMRSSTTSCINGRVS